MTHHAQASADAPAVRARDLSCSDGDDRVLGPIDFTIAPGTGLVVDGDDIRARRTLLSLVLGEVRPTSGSISVFGRGSRAGTDLHSTADAMHPGSTAGSAAGDIAGYATEPIADPDVTVIDRLTTIASQCSVPDPRSAAEELLDELGISAVGERFGLEMSTGQAQLVQIATALIRPSRMIVLDEPERRLDIRSLKRLINALGRRRAEGTTLVIASHAPLVAEHLGDTILHLGEVE